MNILITKIRPNTAYGLAILLSLICILSVVFIPKIANATDPIIGFNPGRIIEDSVFTNTSSMDVNQIQAFLNYKVPSCDTNGTQPATDFGRPDLTHAQYAATRGWPAPPYPCLKDYIDNGLSAAQIIFNVSQTYRINPQVFIVLLQKEQGLVTDKWPLPTQYRAATGYGCPDTAPCDSEYYGLTNQLTWSGIMFRSILNNSPTWYSPYILGNNYVQWSPNSSCGGTNVFIQNRSTQALYNYTPYQPNQAALNAGYGTGDSCSAYGNRNFYLYFRDWFGYNSGPVAFKTATSSTVYIPVQGYKLAVPQIAIMQDYGISIESIQTVSQTYVDAIPTPPSINGVNLGLSHVVKSPYDDDEDNGTVYLISRGKRYAIQSIQQLNDFGFLESDITYLPLGYIHAMSDGGALSSFVSSPYGSVFKITSTTKQIIFEYNTYISQNPSDRITPLSYYLVDKIPSGTPITSRPVMLKNKDGDVVTLYQNNLYYSIPSYSVYLCWGLENSSVPVYRLPQNNYVAAYTPQSSLNCTVNDGTNNYTLNNTSKYSIPGAFSIIGTTINADLKALADKIPTRTTALKQYIKSPDSAAVWLIEESKRRLIPSYYSFRLLGLTDSDIDTINSSALIQIPTNGIKLADGQLVKESSSATVYVIANNQRVAYNSIDTFINFRNKWYNIESYSTSSLDQYYPYNSNSVSSTLIDKTSNKAYVVGYNSCYILNSTSLTAMGKDISVLSAAQSYESSIFKSINLSSCLPATMFIRQSGQSLVYWLDGGQKHALNTYSAMLAKNGGISPQVMVLDQNFISSITTGVSYN